MPTTVDLNANNNFYSNAALNIITDARFINERTAALEVLRDGGDVPIPKQVEVSAHGVTFHYFIPKSARHVHFSYTFEPRVEHKPEAKRLTAHDNYGHDLPGSERAREWWAVIDAYEWLAVAVCFDDKILRQRVLNFIGVMDHYLKK